MGKFEIILKERDGENVAYVGYLECLTIDDAIRRMESDLGGHGSVFFQEAKNRQKIEEIKGDMIDAVEKMWHAISKIGR